MSVVVDARHLSCQSGRKYLVHDINWRIEAGDHWIVFGMNGCGKTTLLSIISGFRDCTSGSLEVFGESYGNDNVFDLRKRIGWVSSSFFDKILTRESALDIVLGGVSGTVGVRGCVGDADVVKAKRLLSKFGLRGKESQPFSLMSKGERQCVLLARALVVNPEVLILDEPGTGLDIYAREYVLRAIEDLAQRTDMAIVYVTHYAEEILPSFDKTLLLRQGSLYAQGSTRELFNSATMSDFLGHSARVCWRDDGTLSMSVDAQGTFRDLTEETGA